MKKLMVVAAIVCAAAFSQAASMNWGTDPNGLKDPAGNDAMGEGYITMYMFAIDSATYSDLTKGGEDAVSAAVWGAYGSQLASADASYADDGMGQIILTDPTAYGSGNTAYAAIVMAYDAGSGITHYKGNVGSYTFDSDADATVTSMDTLVFGDNGSTAVTWQSVPEPTSGLLLLLGVGALALRRRLA